MSKCKINWDNEKNNIQKYLIQGKQIVELCNIYNVSRKTMKNILLKFDLMIYYKPIFTCKYCGEQFYSKQKCAGHVSVCELNPNRNKHIEQLEQARSKLDYINNKQECNCQYCNRLFYRKCALVIHERACKLNPNKDQWIHGSLGNKGATKGYPIWNKGKTMFTDERVLKSRNTLKESIKSGNYRQDFHHTDISKRKLRESMIEYIKRTGNGEFGQHYSKKACEYIDNLNEEMGWNLIHALNGGEKQVCGYFLDGYDEELNIAFEYDEKRHYEDVYNNILCERDIKRQEEIIKELGCSFYRYNETLNIFYKV